MSGLRRKNLGISWVQGEFNAALLQGKSFVQGWYAPLPVHTLEEFNIAIAEAVRALDATGADVSLVYESELFTHPFMQVPPLSDQDLWLHLRHRLQQEHEEKPVLFRYRKSLTHHDQKGVLLHVIEENFMDVLVRICREFELYPLTFVPLSEIMEQEMFRFGLAGDEIILMVGLFDNLTEILVSRGDGQTLFLRDLGYATTTDTAKRIITEIKRSMLYTNQQFMLPVQRIGLIGENAEAIAAVIGADFDIPVQSDEERVDRYFWAQEVTLLSRTIPNNMMPIKYQFLRSSRTLRLLTASLLAGLMVASCAMLMYVEYMVWADKPKPVVMGLAMEQAIEQRDALRRAVVERQTLDERLHLMQANEVQAMPMIFLSHLPDVLPAQLLLLDASIEHQGKGWSFRLAGKVEGDISKAPKALQALEQTLQATPISGRIIHSWQEEWLEAIRQGGAGQHNVEFLIEGVL